MRRSVVFLLAFVLSLTTAVALIATALTLPGRPVGQDLGATDVAAVHRFYAAVNEALRTGTPPALADLVAPELLRTVDRPRDASGTALRPTIDRLRSAFPGRQLAVEDLIAAGDQVIAVVTVAGGGHDSVLGFPVTGPAGEGSAVDRFRLDGDRIVGFGRWEPDAGATSAQPLFAAPLSTLPEGPAAVEVNRATLPPGARLSPLIGAGPEVLMLEAGALTVRLLGLGPQGNVVGTPPGGEVPLRPGDLTIVPTGTPFAVDNDGQVPSVLLEVALRPTAERSPENEGIDASALSPAALLPGAAVQLIAGGAVADLPNGPATVVAARLTLASGAGIAPHPVTRMELLAVEAGTIRVEVSAGEGHLTLATGAESLAAHGTPASRSGGGKWGGAVEAGEGAALPTGTTYAATNAGAEPATILVVRVVPAESRG